MCLIILYDLISLVMETNQDKQQKEDKMKKKNKISNDTIDKLTDIYVKWGEDNNIKDPTSADEVILRDDINNEQRKWLESFIENWNIAEDLDRYIHREEKI